MLRVAAQQKFVSTTLKEGNEYLLRSYSHDLLYPTTEFFKVQCYISIKKSEAACYALPTLSQWNTTLSLFRVLWENSNESGAKVRWKDLKKFTFGQPLSRPYTINILRNIIVNTLDCQLYCPCMGDIEDLRKCIEQNKFCLIFFAQVSSIAQIIDRVWHRHCYCAK